MTPRVGARLLVCAYVAATVSLFAHQSAAIVDEAELVAARAFAARIGAYVALQQTVVRTTAARPTSTDATHIAVRRAGLVASMVTARSGAGQGDIFSPDVSARFRALIHEAFRGKDRRAMRRTLREDDPVRKVVLRVNDVYPETIPSTTMPPTLLRALPVLPPEIAYRIIGRALMLLDVRTNLIIDFIPDALPGVR